MNQIYYRELKKFEILSDDVARDMIIEYQNGNKAVLNKIIECHLRLVVFYAHKFQYFLKMMDLFDVEDLISEGNLGMIKAIEMYKPEKNVSFSFFAHYYIITYIRHFFRDNKNTMTNANNSGKLDLKIKARLDDLSQQMMQNLTASDLSGLGEFYAVNLDKYDNNIIKNPDFETAPLFSEEGAVEDELEREDTLSRLQLSIAKLTEREQQVVKGYYGLDEERIKSPQLAEQMGLTKAGVLHMKERALKKLNIMMNT
jgi:RNA polymerase sigma factor (sigma-70 family)